VTESLSAILARLPEQAVPDRLAAVHAVVRFETTDPRGRVCDTVGIRIAQSAVAVTDDEPDVTIRCTPQALAVGGQAS